MSVDKKRKFLVDKLNEIIQTVPKSKITLDDFMKPFRNGLDINIPGVSVKKEQSRWKDDERYKIVNAANNGCELTIERYKRGNCLCASFVIQDVSTYWHLSLRRDVVFHFLRQLPDIEKEFIQIAADVDKKEKIADISQNSIKTWLKVICKEIHRPYYITIDTHKTTLSVKMKNSTQLDIPIYYSQFQKIIPEILNTIHQYEELINNTKFKINISNNKPGQKWVGDKTDKNGSKN